MFHTSSKSGALPSPAAASGQRADGITTAVQKQAPEHDFPSHIEKIYTKVIKEEDLGNSLKIGNGLFNTSGTVFAELHHNLEALELPLELASTLVLHPSRTEWEVKVLIHMGSGTIEGAVFEITGKWTNVVKELDLIVGDAIRLSKFSTGENFILMEKWDD